MGSDGHKSTVLGRPSGKTALLDAALELVLEGGASALTYEALAERSGMSKGGVLYHFPNSEEMARAVRAYVRERYRQATAEVSATLPKGPAQALKGYVVASASNRSKLDAISAKIMTSGLWDSAEGTANHVERFAEISEGVGFDRAALVYLATEGLWFIELAGFSPFTPVQRQRALELLLSIADGGDIGDTMIEDGDGAL